VRSIVGQLYIVSAVDAAVHRRLNVAVRQSFDVRPVRTVEVDRGRGVVSGRLAAISAARDADDDDNKEDDEEKSKSDRQTDDQSDVVV